MMLWGGLLEMSKLEDVLRDSGVLELFPMVNAYFLVFRIKVIPYRSVSWLWL